MASRKSEDIQAELDSFVKELITQYESQHQVTVVDHDMDTQDMIETGRHCASNVFRVNLTYKSGVNQGRSSVIVKVPHLSSCYENFERMGMYRTETYMHTKVLPSFREVWQGEILAPTTYAASDSGILALENLAESGFCIPSRDSLLGLNECEVVLKTLAQFHAVSVKYFQRHGTQEFDALMTMAADSGFTIHGLIGKIRKYVCPLLSVDQQAKWTLFESNCQALLMGVYKSRNLEGFNVLLHGDVHSHNLLLKEDKCKFIDFQLSRRGSPVLDLIYFLVSSVKWEVFEHHRERIFTHYLRTLNEVLEELGCASKYSSAEFHADFEKYKLYCIFVLIVLIPILWSETGTLERMNESGVNRMDDIIQSPDYLTHFKRWIEIV